MLSVATRYIGPTDTLGSRIRATVRLGNEVKATVVRPCSDRLSCSDAHLAVAKLAVRKFVENGRQDWDSTWRLVEVARMESADGKGFVWPVGTSVQLAELEGWLASEKQVEVGS